MKKAILFLLVVTIILSNSITLAGAEDFEKVYPLVKAGYLTGDENGNLRLNDSITRAEFTVILCRLQGLEEAAKAAGKITSFADVKTDHWANGYISLCFQMGIINGYEDGTFRPDNYVKTEEIIKCIVAAYGYNASLVAKYGGYPYGYIYLAEKMNIVQEKSVFVGEFAKRLFLVDIMYKILIEQDISLVNFDEEEKTFTFKVGKIRIASDCYEVENLINNTTYMFTENTKIHYKGQPISVDEIMGNMISNNFYYSVENERNIVYFINFE